MQSKTKRLHLKHLVFATLTGDWSFGHTNPLKVTREIATWDELRFLSDVVASGPYEQKKLHGEEQNLVSPWLYLIPEQPMNATEAAAIEPPTLPLAAA